MTKSFTPAEVAALTAQHRERVAPAIWAQREAQEKRAAARQAYIDDVKERLVKFFPALEALCKEHGVIMSAESECCSGYLCFDSFDPVRHSVKLNKRLDDDNWFDMDLLDHKEVE